MEEEEFVKPGKIELEEFYAKVLDFYKYISDIGIRYQSYEKITSAIELLEMSLEFMRDEIAYTIEYESRD